MTCKECKFRKLLVDRFDIHIDWRDCWKEDCKYKRKKESEDCIDVK